MQPQTKTVGGGPATGLAGDFTEFLRQGLTTGTFGNPGQQAMGAQPIGSTQGIAGLLNAVLSPGAGQLGVSLQEIIKQQQLADIGNLRARFSMGGVGGGTPGAYAESLYRAQAAPQAALQIGQLQRSFLDPLFQAIYGLSQRGIPQAQTAISPSPFSQIASGVGGAAMGFVPFAKALNFGGGFGGGLDISKFTPPDLSGVPAFDPRSIYR